MKPNIKIPAAIVSLGVLWLVLSLCVGGFVSGCQSPPDRITYNTIGGIDAVATTSFSDVTDLAIEGKVSAADYRTASAWYNDLHKGLLIVSTASSQGTNAIVPANLLSNSTAFASFIIKLKTNK